MRPGLQNPTGRPSPLAMEIVLSVALSMKWWCKEESCLYLITFNINPWHKVCLSAGCRWFPRWSPRTCRGYWLGWNGSWSFDELGFILIQFGGFTHRVPLSSFTARATGWWYGQRQLADTSVIGYEMVAVPVYFFAVFQPYHMVSSPQLLAADETPVGVPFWMVGWWSIE